MKIESSTKTVTSGSVSSGAARTGKGPRSPQSSSGGDVVQLSPLSTQLQALGSSIADTPGVDSARVAEIRQAIAEGRFKVNPDVVADHLLQTARELIQSRKS